MAASRNDDAPVDTVVDGSADIARDAICEDCDRYGNRLGLWSIGAIGPTGHHGGVEAARRGRLLPRRGRASMIAVVSCLTLSALASSCGDADVIHGIVRDDPLDVGAVVVTDVTESGAYAEHEPGFTMKARPGSLLVVYFGYTNCPDLCPTTLALVRAARRELGNDGTRIDLAMVTVDPERDTAEVLDGYLASFTDQFHALHPSSSEELTTAQDAFLATSSIRTNSVGEIEVGHTATTYVVNDEGRVVVEWPFGVDKNTMVNDFRILLKSA